MERGKRRTWREEQKEGKDEGDRGIRTRGLKETEPEGAEQLEGTVKMLSGNGPKLTSK